MTGSAFSVLLQSVQAAGENVEAGRLLGWLKSPAEVVEELGYAEEEATRLYACTKMISPASGRLLLSGGEGGADGSDVP